MKIPLGNIQLTSFNSAAQNVAKGLSWLGVASAVVVAAGGSGYNLNDLLTLSGGTALGGLAAQLRVTSVDGNGAVLAAGVSVMGLYSAFPSNPVSTTGGAGSSATFTLTPTNDIPPPNAVWCELTAEGANVRWRDDGVAPTTTVGNLITPEASGVSPFVYSGPVSKLQVIGVASGSILNVAFYGVRRYQ